MTINLDLELDSFDIKGGAAAVEDDVTPLPCAEELFRSLSTASQAETPPRKRSVNKLFTPIGTPAKVRDLAPSPQSSIRSQSPRTPGTPSKRGDARLPLSEEMRRNLRGERGGSHRVNLEHLEQAYNKMSARLFSKNPPALVEGWKFVKLHATEDPNTYLRVVMAKNGTIVTAYYQTKLEVLRDEGCDEFRWKVQLERNPLSRVTKS